MKLILKLEELAMWMLSIIALLFSGVEWWWYLIMFIGPDISMLGYLIGNKMGAWSYNLFHHKGIAILILLLGFVMNLPNDGPSNLPDTDFLIYVGIILFGHSSMDRFFGYGLKYENGFKFTHLGEIGKK